MRTHYDTQVSVRSNAIEYCAWYERVLAKGKQCTYDNARMPLTRYWIVKSIQFEVNRILFEVSCFFSA